MPSSDSTALSTSSNTRTLSLSLAVAILALALAAYLQPQRFNLRSDTSAPPSTTSAMTLITSASSALASAAAVLSGTKQRTPVHFISHGGPPTLFDTKHSAHKQWAKTGKAISEYAASYEGGLKGIVFVSAHWESDNDSILINTNACPLIYDFYGFPANYYAQKFPHTLVDDKGISEVGQALSQGGIKWQKVKNRGLDHGVWVPGKIMFPDSPPAPLLQVSLPQPSPTTQLEQSLALGRALAPLRDQGYLVVASGQTVHNLRDFFMRSGASSLPSRNYGGPFLAKTNEWVETGSGTVDEVKDVRAWKDFRKAVPEDDHFAPLVVAVGAGAVDAVKGKVEMDLDEGALGWGFYSWA